MLNHTLKLTVWPGPAGFGGAKQTDNWFAQRRGHVHWPGVVGYHQITAPQPFDHFGQRGLASEIQTSIRCSAADCFSQRLIICAAEYGEMYVRMFGGQLAGQFRKMFHRPALVQPTGARLQRDPTRWRRIPFGVHGGGDLRSLGKPNKVFLHRHSEAWQHGQIPIDGVGVE